MKKIQLWNHPWVLSILSALFLCLSFPPFNLGLLQIPAFILLFRLSVISVSVRQMIYYTYPSFVLWNLFSTYWLMMATFTGGAAAIFANAALMLIPLWMIRQLFLSDMNPVLASFIAASAWLSYEFLHHQWDLAWPWLTLGNAWSNHTGIIQYISVTGVWGISFWVVFTAALTYQSIVTKIETCISKCGAHSVCPAALLSTLDDCDSAAGRQTTRRCDRSAQLRLLPGFRRAQFA